MKLVIDMGGTSVKYATWNGMVLSDIETFQSPKTWEEMKNSLAEAKVKIDEKVKIKSVNISVPGVPNKDTGRIDGASSLHYLHDVRFIQELETVFGCPVLFENDANCASLAELHLGAGKDVSDMLFLVVGTGIGGTVVYNREIVSGHHAYAGEFGMMLVDGRQEWAVLGSAVHMARSVSRKKGMELSGKDVFDLAEAGDVVAVEAVEQLYHYLALGIYNLQYILDPEIIIIGGGISKKEGLIEHIERHLREIMTYGQRSPLFPKLAVCHYGNDANLLGAAMLS